MLSYYSQYSLMKETKSVGSFSIDICAILIVANILRVFFWFTTGFADNLLIQSFLVLAIQYLILDICIKLGYKQTQETSGSGFWRWDSLAPFGSYHVNLVLFGAAFALGIGLITAFFMWMEVSSYGTVLGLTSLGVEATLAFPQLIHNQRCRSVEGLSIVMIMMWFFGDFFKTIYFILEVENP